MMTCLLPFVVVVVLICCFNQVQVEASSNLISRIARPLLSVSRKSTGGLTRPRPYSSSIPYFSDKTDGTICQNPAEYLKQSFLNYAQLKVIEDLKSGKVDPSIFSAELSMTAIEPLLISALKGNQFDLVANMIKYGVDTDISDKEFKTPLILAVLKNRLDLVKLLLQQPSLRINAPDCDDFTALYYAVKFGRFEIATLLLEAGAAPFNVNENEYNEIKVLPLQLLKLVFEGSKDDILTTDRTKKKFLLAFFRAINNDVRTIDSFIETRKSSNLNDNLVDFIKNLIKEERAKVLKDLRSGEYLNAELKSYDHKYGDGRVRSTLYLSDDLTVRNIHFFIINDRTGEFLDLIRDGLIPMSALSATFDKDTEFKVTLLKCALFKNQLKLAKVLMNLGVGLDEERSGDEVTIENNILVFYMLSSRVVPNIKMVKYLVEEGGVQTDCRGVSLWSIAHEMHNYPIARYLLNRSSLNPGEIIVPDGFDFDYFLDKIMATRSRDQDLYPDEVEFYRDLFEMIGNDCIEDIIAYASCNGHEVLASSLQSIHGGLIMHNQ